MKKVLVTLPKERVNRYGVEPPENVEIEYISNKYDREKFYEKAKDVEYLFLSLTSLDGDMIRRLPKLKLIQSHGVGYDGIDLEAAREAGVFVCNARGVNKEAVAEHTLGLMIASLREIVKTHADTIDGGFKESLMTYEEEKVREFSEVHVGLVGMGDIGIEVIKRLKPFGSKISYYNRSRKEDLEEEYGIEYLSLDEIYETCDIISLHLPLTKDTENMINKESLAKMKEDAIIINTSRGGLVNQADLRDALEENKIGGAALDTFEPEPPGEDHPLMNLSEDARKKVIFTPHIAGVTARSFMNMQVQGWENIKRVMNGERPKNIVNGL